MALKRSGSEVVSASSRNIGRLAATLLHAGPGQAHGKEQLHACTRGQVVRLLEQSLDGIPDLDPAAFIHDQVVAVVGKASQPIARVGQYGGLVFRAMPLGHVGKQELAGLGDHGLMPGILKPIPWPGPLPGVPVPGPGCGRSRRVGP